MGYDLIVRNGIVVDGTGLARRRADVGVRDGRIVDVGHLSESVTGAKVVDADGLFVAPGIIDAHTHYDPQLTFDPWATSSCYHGVTTVLAGNCGFSIAPTARARPRLHLAHVRPGRGHVARRAVRGDVGLRELPRVPGGTRADGSA